jgi:N-acetylneuraminic acid mutarotase
VLLLDGRVLSGTPWNWSDQPVLPAEIWDPATESWSVTGTQVVPSNGSPAVALPDGRVLVAGGIVWDSFNGGTDHPLARTEIWDPATGEWTRVGDMSTPRTGHALALVAGRALICGGFSEYPDAPGLDTCELFDAETGTWSPAARRNHPGASALATLKDGRLLLTGGTQESGGNKPELQTAEIYDPAARTWRPVAPMLEKRAGHALTVLSDGRVLATGGAQGYFSYSTTSAEVFDARTGQWSRTASMERTRRFHGAVLLPNGEVLVVGGYPGGEFASEIYTSCD